MIALYLIVIVVIFAVTQHMLASRFKHDGFGSTTANIGAAVLGGGFSIGAAAAGFIYLNRNDSFP